MGCEILRDEREETDDCSHVLQPSHLIKKLEKTFGKLLKHERKTKTPRTPRTVQVVPKEEDEKLDAQEHHWFRSGVGSLFHLLKHSRPELSNPMRELTRCMSGLGPENMKEMCCVIKWVLDHPNVGWKCQPQVEFDDCGVIKWRMTGMSDAMWGSNEEDGRSVMGHLLCFMGVLAVEE